MFNQQRGTINFCWLADCRCWRPVTSAVSSVQMSIKYGETLNQWHQASGAHHAVAIYRYSRETAIKLSVQEPNNKAIHMPHVQCACIHMTPDDNNSTRSKLICGRSGWVVISCNVYAYTKFDSGFSWLPVYCNCMISSTSLMLLIQYDSSSQCSCTMPPWNCFAILDGHRQLYTNTHITIHGM